MAAFWRLPEGWTLTADSKNAPLAPAGTARFRYTGDNLEFSLSGSAYKAIRAYPPNGVGTELQYRSDQYTFRGVTGSSVSGPAIQLAQGQASITLNPTAADTITGPVITLTRSAIGSSQSPELNFRRASAVNFGDTVTGNILGKIQYYSYVGGAPVLQVSEQSFWSNTTGANWRVIAGGLSRYEINTNKVTLFAALDGTTTYTAELSSNGWKWSNSAGTASAQGAVFYANASNYITALMPTAVGHVLTLTDVGGGILEPRWKPAGVIVLAEYRWSTTTTGAPGSGQVRVNNAAPASATQVAIHQLGDDDVDWSLAFSSIIPDDTIYIQDRDDATKWLEYVCTAPGTDQGTYYTFAVTETGFGGVLISNNSVSKLVMRRGGSGGGGGGTGTSTNDRLDQILNPANDKTFDMADYTLKFHYAATMNEDSMVLESATDAAGAGALLYLHTAGTTLKHPLRVQAGDGDPRSYALLVSYDGEIGMGTFSPSSLFRLNVWPLDPATGGSLYVNGKIRLDVGSDATGDLFYRAADFFFTRIPIGVEKKFLRSDGVAPSWQFINMATDLSGILPIANGGTGIASAPTAIKQILMSTGTAWEVGTLAGAGTISIGYVAGTMTITGAVTGAFPDGIATSTELQSRDPSGTAFKKVGHSSVTGDNIQLGGLLTLNQAGASDNSRITSDATGVTASLIFEKYHNSDVAPLLVDFRRATGTSGSPAAIASGQFIGKLRFLGWVGAPTNTFAEYGYLDCQYDMTQGAVVRLGAGTVGQARLTITDTGAGSSSITMWGSAASNWIQCNNSGIRLPFTIDGLVLFTDAGGYLQTVTKVGVTNGWVLTLVAGLPAWQAVPAATAPTLDQVGNPNASKTFTMGANTLAFNYTAGGTTTESFKVTTGGVAGLIVTASGDVHVKELQAGFTFNASGPARIGPLGSIQRELRVISSGSFNELDLQMFRYEPTGGVAPDGPIQLSFERGRGTRGLGAASLIANDGIGQLVFRGQLGVMTDAGKIRSYYIGSSVFGLELNVGSQTFTVSNSGFQFSGGTDWGVYYRDGSGNVVTTTAGAGFLKKTSSTAVPSFVAQIALGTEVSGILPIVNGGTAINVGPTATPAPTGAQVLMALSSGNWQVGNIQASGTCSLTYSAGVLTVVGAAGSSITLGGNTGELLYKSGTSSVGGVLGSLATGTSNLTLVGNVTFDRVGTYAGGVSNIIFNRENAGATVVTDGQHVGDIVFNGRLAGGMTQFGTIEAYTKTSPANGPTIRMVSGGGNARLVIAELNSSVNSVLMECLGGGLKYVQVQNGGIAFSGFAGSATQGALYYQETGFLGGLQSTIGVLRSTGTNVVPSYGPVDLSSSSYVSGVLAIGSIPVITVAKGGTNLTAGPTGAPSAAGGQFLFALSSGNWQVGTLAASGTCSFTLVGSTLTIVGAAGGGLTMPAGSSELLYRNAGSIGLVASSTVNGSGGITLANTFAVQTNKLQVDSVGLVGMGGYAPVDGGSTAILNVQGTMRIGASTSNRNTEFFFDTGQSASPLTYWRKFGTTAVGAYLIVERGRGSEASGSRSNLNNGDYIANFAFTGYYSGVGAQAYWNELNSLYITGGGQMELKSASTNTNQPHKGFVTEMQSIGSPTAGFGLTHVYRLESSTTLSREAAAIQVAWLNATDGSQVGVLSLRTVNKGGATWVGASGVPAATALRERAVFGGYHDLTHATLQSLFTIDFASGDHLGVSGHIMLIFGVKNAQRLSFVRRGVSFTCVHNNFNGRLGIDFRQVSNEDSNGNTDGQDFTEFYHAINADSARTLATPIVYGPSPTLTTTTVTYKVRGDHSLTATAFGVWYNIIYSGEVDIALV